MKRTGFLFIACILALTPAISQDALHKAFQQGNAEQLAPYMPGELELCIINQEQTVSKAKALQDLKNFFSSHKVVSYKPLHSGGSKDQAKSYTIGQLSTSNGDFRVYIYYKANGDSYQVQEIRIEE